LHCQEEGGREHPELLDVVLTFEDLENWLDEETSICPVEIDSEDDRFRRKKRARARFSHRGRHGSGLHGNGAVNIRRSCRFSGISNVEQALKGISEWKPEHGIFFELTACAGSCVNGPKAARNSSIARRRLRVSSTPRQLQCFRASSRSKRGHYTAAPDYRAKRVSELQLLKRCAAWESTPPTTS
jgi:iron only hydrogenase large subunit-like protein